MHKSENVYSLQWLLAEIHMVIAKNSLEEDREMPRNVFFSTPAAACHFGFSQHEVMNGLQGTRISKLLI